MTGGECCGLVVSGWRVRSTYGRCADRQRGEPLSRPARAKPAVATAPAAARPDSVGLTTRMRTAVANEATATIAAAMMWMCER
ncbi:hypothetical protein B1R27_13235 [Streptomyces sp. GKU 895]|nr:hypothetical protein B1R27_13235 [Streptomyces sp. GKU 895]